MENFLSNIRKSSSVTPSFIFLVSFIYILIKVAIGQEKKNFFKGREMSGENDILKKSRQ